MARFSIEIEVDKGGHVGWRFNVSHISDQNSNADCKDAISVVNKLREFIAQLETELQGQA